MGLLVVLVGALMGTGCNGNSDVQAEAPSLGIPESQYEFFASLIRNINTAEKEVERVILTKNRVAIRKAKAQLEKERESLKLLFTDKYGEETISRWTTMVYDADDSMAKIKATQTRGKELLEQFLALGAKGSMDTDGYITHLNCRNITMPDEMIARIANCSKLQNLNLKHTGFKDSQFEHLANLTEITNLDLSDNPFSGEEINKLGALTKLISLSLAGASVNDAAVNQFESISHLKSIRSLNISNTKLGTESYEKITRFFRQADVKY
jgi:Leucine-rich repeat (LRR) protein|tara:strand:+ start:458 stop:1258 length:801 start_codon:yes stop_codon:yes gene_type:complete